MFFFHPFFLFRLPVLYNICLIRFFAVCIIFLFPFFKTVEYKVFLHRRDQVTLLWGSCKYASWTYGTHSAQQRFFRRRDIGCDCREIWRLTKVSSNFDMGDVGDGSRCKSNREKPIFSERPNWGKRSAIKIGFFYCSPRFSAMCMSQLSIVPHIHWRAYTHGQVTFVNIRTVVCVHVWNRRDFLIYTYIPNVVTP